jgi:hypothetical protein
MKAYFAAEVRNELGFCRAEVAVDVGYAKSQLEILDLICKGTYGRKCVTPALSEADCCGELTFLESTFLSDGFELAQLSGRQRTIRAGNQGDVGEKRDRIASHLRVFPVLGPASSAAAQDRSAAKVACRG